MKLRDLVVRNRSYRRFVQSPRPDRALLKELVDLARLTASGANLQPLRYWLVDNPTDCALVFPHTSWAGLLGGWRPAADEAPTAYVLVLEAEGGVTPQADAGIAMQTLLLAATEKGYGGCIIGSIKRDKIRAALGISEAFKILYAVALGKPSEKAVVEDAVDFNVDYYRAADDIHHAPKHKLETLIINGL